MLVATRLSMRLFPHIRRRKESKLNKMVYFWHLESLSKKLDHPIVLMGNQITWPKLCSRKFSLIAQIGIGTVQTITMPSVTVYYWNFTTWKAKAGGLQVQGQPGHMARLFKNQIIARDPRWWLGCRSRQRELCDSKTLLRCWSHTWWK
jgi:hypothetical protein